jgi:hypothetical protein
VMKYGRPWFYLGLVARLPLCLYFVWLAVTDTNR